MRDFEIGLIERFIDKFPDAYDEVIYSYPVGSPPPFDPIVNQATEGSADYLYRRKIDILGFKGNDIDILEVKKQAGTSAIGQVKGYRTLYVRDEKPNVKVGCKIITDIASKDLYDVAFAEDVKIIVV